MIDFEEVQTHKALVVLGMHRSGTSAIAGLLEQLGVFMGARLFGPQKGVNEKGFFENSKLVAINEQLFDRLLQRWDDPYALNFQAYDLSALSEFLPKARRLVMQEYSPHRLWGMKDPRTSLHIQFWQEVFKSFSFEPCYILMVRNPMEVAQSVARRDKISFEHTFRLWLNYTLSSYLACYQEKLKIVRFDTLMSSPGQILYELSENFSIGLDSKSVSFIEKGLWHNKVTEKPSEQIGQLALDVYQALSQKNIDHDVVVAYAGEYFEQTKNENTLMRSYYLRVIQEEVYYRTHFLNAYESFWWKLSWPLRKLEIALRGKKY